MTAQISDNFLLDQTEYVLAGISGKELFSPQAFGLTPVASCTACWRGYQAVFTILKEQLHLHTLSLNVKDDNELPALGNATAERIDSHFLTWRYEQADVAMDYTGGLLLGQDLIRKLSVHMGFQKVWKYERVVELIFENGRLIRRLDQSAKIAEIRETMLARMANKKGKVHGLYDDAAQFVADAFDRGYRF